MKSGNLNFLEPPGPLQACNGTAFFITNKMQSYTIFFIVVKALHVSGGFPAHHQELKNCTYSTWYLLSLVAATASVVEIELSIYFGKYLAD
jgi:hypothetical protein